MSVASVEQYLIDTVKARFGNRLRAVDSLPDDWDAETFQRALRATPGVFVVFGGGPARDVGSAVEIESRWALVAVTTNAGSELARRRGDAREIGAYEIIEILAQLLHGHVVPGVGTLSLVDVDNLFQGPVDKQGASVYGAAFTLPMVLAAPGADPASLDDFRTFEAEHDLAPADGAVEARDHVELPQ